MQGIRHFRDWEGKIVSVIFRDFPWFSVIFRDFPWFQKVLFFSPKTDSIPIGYFPWPPKKAFWMSGTLSLDTVTLKITPLNKWGHPLARQCCTNKQDIGKSSGLAGLGCTWSGVSVSYFVKRCSTSPLQNIPTAACRRTFPILWRFLASISPRRWHINEVWKWEVGD